MEQDETRTLHPGPWWVGAGGTVWSGPIRGRDDVGEEPGTTVEVHILSKGPGGTDADLEFVVEARDRIGRLVDEIVALEERLDQYDRLAATCAAYAEDRIAVHGFAGIKIPWLDALIDEIEHLREENRRLNDDRDRQTGRRQAPG